MAESNVQNFNHLKIHSQYSICEGAIKIDDLKDYSKENKIRSLALCDSINLCGALEFAEKISKAGTQPIIGTQINFKYAGELGLIPTNMVKVSENDANSIVKLLELLEDSEDVQKIYSNFEVEQLIENIRNRPWAG